MYRKVLTCATFLDRCYKTGSIFEVHVDRFKCFLMKNNAQNMIHILDIQVRDLINMMME